MATSNYTKTKVTDPIGLGLGVPTSGDEWIRHSGIPAGFPLKFGDAGLTPNGALVFYIPVSGVEDTDDIFASGVISGSGTLYRMEKKPEPKLVDSLIIKPGGRHAGPFTCVANSSTKTRRYDVYELD